MAAEHRRVSSELGIEEDIESQRREWAIERIGWAGMALVVVLGLAGVFGGGPLSGAEVSTPDARLTLRYQRFTRHGAPSTLEVEFDHARSEDDSLATVWFDREFLDGVQVQGIIPEPVESEMDEDRVIFAFSRDESAARAAVVFDIVADRMGARAGMIGAGSGSGVRFRQFVYP